MSTQRHKGLRSSSLSSGVVRRGGEGARVVRLCLLLLEPCSPLPATADGPSTCALLEPMRRQRLSGRNSCRDTVIIWNQCFRDDCTSRDRRLLVVSGPAPGGRTHCYFWRNQRRFHTESHVSHHSDSITGIGFARKEKNMNNMNSIGLTHRRR